MKDSEKGNIRPICKGCTESFKPDPAIMTQTLEWFVGQFCQLKFVFVGKEGITERMWVKVTGLAENKDCELRGSLYNTPVLLNLRHGDVFEFNRSEILKVTGEE